MSYIAMFGSYVPTAVITNADLAQRLDCTPDWILQASGIEERRYAAEDETVVSMGIAAARQCLDRASITPEEIGILLAVSGTPAHKFPGPAAEIAQGLGLNQTPAIDLPMASAGSLFAMSLASQLASAYGSALVVASEKMSAIARHEPLNKNTSILFGDGAGACLIRPDRGHATLIDSVLHSDGSFAASLQVTLEGRLEMDGRSVILQASRKIPNTIRELLDRNQIQPADIDVFLMHQANQNLIDRVARALDVAPTKFYSNIRRYGNTSSASMLIAADEWWAANQPGPESLICFATFGAGFHWGALLAQTRQTSAL